MERRLAREEGVLVATSSGLNIAAAVQMGPRARSRPGGRDGRRRLSLKYLAGDLKSEWREAVSPNFASWNLISGWLARLDGLRRVLRSCV
jgi:hypothetical protein